MPHALLNSTGDSSEDEEESEEEEEPTADEDEEEEQPAKKQRGAQYLIDSILYRQMLISPTGA